MTARELLLADKSLVAHWRTVVHANDTARVLALAWAELMHGASMTAEQITGAKMFEDMLFRIAEDDPLPVEMPNIGMNHDIDDPRSNRILASDRPSDKPATEPPAPLP